MCFHVLINFPTVNCSCSLEWFPIRAVSFKTLESVWVINFVWNKLITNQLSCVLLQWENNKVQNSTAPTWWECIWSWWIQMFLGLKNLCLCEKFLTKQILLCGHKYLFVCFVFKSWNLLWIFLYDVLVTFNV